MSVSKEAIVARLRQNLPQLKAQYSLRRIGFFGALAATSPEPVHEVDLIVELEQPIGLGFVDLCEALKSCLGCSVNVLTSVGATTIGDRCSDHRYVRQGSNDWDLLAALLEAVQRAIHYVAGMTYEEFATDTKTQDAALRALAVLAEVSQDISREFKAHLPMIRWNRLEGQWDKLSHGYFGINLDIVWQTITVDLPPLELQFRQILTHLN